MIIIHGLHKNTGHIGCDLVSQIFDNFKNKLNRVKPKPNNTRTDAPPGGGNFEYSKNKMKKRKQYGKYLGRSCKIKPKNTPLTAWA